ncbi:hypothetical protein F4604DRAFT_1684636 [Suillus subluteus]|nr:hypothetical protein F4604DRAFT_1684636 [Suillus subluteus]
MHDTGPYLGLEGHVVQMYDDIFHICQDISNEEVEVSKYYLDHSANTTISRAPPDLDSIDIGDYIQVMDGKHMGRRSVMNWYAKGSTNLWFQDISEDERKCNDGLLSILVPTAMVQQTNLARTIQYTKDKGYDVRPGDIVTVVHGLEYQTKGVMHSVDFPNTHLTILSDGDQLLICDQDTQHLLGFFQERYRLSSKTCTITVSGQQRTTLKLPDVVTSASISDPWTVDAQDSIDAEAKNLPDNGLLPWLMTKEFSSKLLAYHMLLKVSLSFLRGKLYKRFVSTACPDPFCSESGPAPEGCIAAFCTSNSAGTALEHYHIPASDLSLAPPHKKQ